MPLELTSVPGPILIALGSFAAGALAEIKKRWFKQESPEIVALRSELAAVRADVVDLKRQLAGVRIRMRRDGHRFAQVLTAQNMRIGTLRRIAGLPMSDVDEKPTPPPDLVPAFDEHEDDDERQLNESMPPTKA